MDALARDRRDERKSGQSKLDAMSVTPIAAAFYATVIAATTRRSRRHRPPQA
jgi:hypothetical protein